MLDCDSFEKAEDATMLRIAIRPGEVSLHADLGYKKYFIGREAFFPLLSFIIVVHQLKTIHLCDEEAEENDTLASC